MVVDVNGCAEQIEYRPIGCSGSSGVGHCPERKGAPGLVVDGDADGLVPRGGTGGAYIENRK